MLKVENLVSGRSGRAIPNQFLIDTGDAIYFQSYNTLIAKLEKSYKVSLIKDAFNYSKTTNKYLMQVLRKNTIYKDIDSKQARKYFKEGIFGVLKEDI